MNAFFEFALIFYLALALLFCFVAFGDRRPFKRRPPEAPALPGPPGRVAASNPYEHYDAQLAYLGATYGPRGWLLSLWCTRFETGDVHWEPADADTIGGIADLLGGHAQSRALIEACSEAPGGAPLPPEPSPFVLAVVRDLVDRGSDQGRIHVEYPKETPEPSGAGKAHWLQVCRIEVLMSDIEGHFRARAGMHGGGATRV